MNAPIKHNDAPRFEMSDDDLRLVLRAFCFTPGPWSHGINPDAEQEQQRGVVRPTGDFKAYPGRRWVADVGDPRNPEQGANARLIAFAPALLRFLLGEAVDGNLKAMNLVRQFCEDQPEHATTYPTVVNIK
jgi:hypothetical protein